MFFLISDSIGGGAEQLIFKIASYLQRRSNSPATICVYGQQTTKEWEDHGFKVYYCNNSLKNFYLFCISNREKVVFSSHLMMNALLGIFRTLRILKTDTLIVRESTTVFERFSGFKLLKYKLAYLIGYRNIDLIITQTDQMRSTLLEHQPYLKKRSKVITLPNPFEYPDKSLVEENIKISGKYIVAAGRLIPEKGFEILIESFRMILEEYPYLKLVILGDGPLKEIIKKQINKNNLDNKVFLEGFVTNVYPYFKNAAACVVSSIHEGFPNVLLQMMSQNNTVVSTKCAGGIEDIKGIYIAETNNINSLYKAIKNGLENNNDATSILFEKELNKRTIKAYITEINTQLKTS